MNSNSYFSKSVIYENFLKKAYNNQVTFRNGVDKEFMKLLMEAEIGIVSDKSIMTYKMQLKRVKKYMLSAIEKMMSPELPDEIKNRLNYIKESVTAAQTSRQILNLCAEGLEVTKETTLADTKINT